MPQPRLDSARSRCAVLCVAKSLTVAVLSAAASAHAQSGPPVAASLDAIAVTAARIAQPIGELLADVTVIGSDEIERSGVQSLTELLQRQPGVEITQNGGPGSTSGAFLRGANRGHTLVLIDGLRVGSSSVGATSLEAIPLEQIERIEILRGPASSLYGADAIGGVIQVFTKQAQGSAFLPSASGGYGTHKTSNAAAGLQGALGPLRFSVHAAGTRSDGFNAITNPRNFAYSDDRDGYTSENMGLNATLPWMQHQEIAVHYLRNRLNNQFDGGSAADDRTVTTLETWSVLSRNRIAQRWTSIVTIGEGSDDSVSRTGFGDFPFKTVQRQFAWQNDVTLPVGELSLIAERREEHLATDAGFATDRRDTNSATGVYQVRHGALAIQANLRRDHSSQFGGKTTGGLALGYKISPALRLTAGYSTGFKAPSFNDLYFPQFSNPDLRPETARNAELGAYWTSSNSGVRWQATAIAYRNRIDDLIVFQCDVNFDCLPSNVQRASLTGTTLGLDVSWRETRVKASLDLQRPEDEATGHLLPRRARRHGAVHLLQQAGPVQMGVEVVASSQRFDDAANLVRMGGYAVINLTATWPIVRGWTVLVRGNNVLDKNYEINADYSTGGVTFFAGVRWQP